MDLKILEIKLQEAIAADEKYRRENDAKIRAVENGVGSYDEFKELVQGCHLQPLAKKETINSPCLNASWNHGATPSDASSNGRVLKEIAKFLPAAAKD